MPGTGDTRGKSVSPCGMYIHVGIADKKQMDWLEEYM